MADYDAPSGSCNGLLVQLTDADRLRLEPYLEEISLLANQVLVEPGRPVRRAYFPHDCFVSLEIEFENGPSVEAATIGREGAVGLPLFVNDESFPARVIRQDTRTRIDDRGRSA